MNQKEQIISEQLQKKYLGGAEYFDETIQFYAYFFQDADRLQEFLEKVFSFNKRKRVNVPRRMINRIERFANILNDVNGKIEVKIFFLITAVESLYSLSESELDSKRGILRDFFMNYISNGDRNRLLDGVKYSMADNKYYSCLNCGCMDLSNIADLFTELRNKMAHEGAYGNFSFSSNGCQTLNVLNLYVGNEYNGINDKLKRLKNRRKIKVNSDQYKRRKIYQRVYELSITYNEFREIMIRGMINYTEEYISATGCSN